MAVVFVALAEIQLARNPPKLNSKKTIGKRDVLRFMASYLVIMAVQVFMQTEPQMMGGELWDLVVPAVLFPGIAWVVHKRYLAWCDLAVLTSAKEGDQEESIDTRLKLASEPLLDSEIRNRAGQGDQRLYRLGMALSAVYGLLALCVGRWKLGILWISIALFCLRLSRQERTK